MKEKKIDTYKIFSDEKNTQDLIIFKDWTGTTVQIPINADIKEVFIEFKKIEKSQQNEFDRHIEHNEIYEWKLQNRVIDKPISVEAEIENKIINQKLKEAITSLSDTQKRRINMYYFNMMTQQEIADKEGVSIRAVQYTLNSAIEKLREILKEI